jgi:hypothetical protein
MPVPAASCICTFLHAVCCPVAVAVCARLWQRNRSTSDRALCWLRLCTLAQLPPRCTAKSASLWPSPVSFSQPFCRPSGQHTSECLPGCPSSLARRLPWRLTPPPPWNIVPAWLPASAIVLTAARMASAKGQPDQVRQQASQGSLERSTGEQDQRRREPVAGAGAAQPQAGIAAGAAATGSAAAQPQADIVAGAHEESLAAAEQASRMLQQGEVLHGDVPRTGGQGALRAACKLVPVLRAGSGGCGALLHWLGCWELMAPCLLPLCRAQRWRLGGCGSGVQRSPCPAPTNGNHDRAPYMHIFDCFSV